MENQSQFHTPRASRLTRDNQSCIRNDEFKDFFVKLGAYTDVHQNKIKKTDIILVNNEKVDNDLISSIYDKPKVKIGESRVDIQNLKFQQNLSKKKIPKLSKSQQNAMCKRLTTPRNSKTMVDPQFDFKKPKQTNNIIEYNKEFINSRFDEIENIITVNQLESILRDFSIIDHKINEKPLISEMIFPLCQKNSEGDSIVFESSKLKEVLLLSFIKANENSFWAEISNCIKSARMNRKKCSVYAKSVSLGKQKSVKIISHHKNENSSESSQFSDKLIKDDRCSNYSDQMHSTDSKQGNNKSSDNHHLNNVETQSIEDQIDQVNEVTMGLMNLKFPIITDHFSDTMIDSSPNAQISNDSQEKPEILILKESEQQSQNEINVVERECIGLNEFCNSIEKEINQNNIETSTEINYNSSFDDHSDENNVEFNKPISENDSSNKEIFDFNSYDSLEYESDPPAKIEKNKKIVPTKFEDHNSKYPKFYDDLNFFRKCENKEESCYCYKDHDSAHKYHDVLIKSYNSRKIKRNP